MIVTPTPEVSEIYPTRRSGGGRNPATVLRVKHTEGPSECGSLSWR